MIVLGGGCANARGNKFGIRWESLPQADDFLWGADKSSESGFESQRNKTLHLVGDWTVNSDLLEVVLIHAGKDGHSKQPRRLDAERGGFFLGGGLCGSNHVSSASEVNSQHLHVEANGGANGAGRCVGDVVVF